MTRAEIKTQAKQVLANIYWPCIGAVVLVSIILSAVSGMTGFIGGIGVFFVLPAELGLIIYFTCLSDGMQTVSVIYSPRALTADTISDASADTHG